MSITFPSRRPNSYFVSTRISPFSAAISDPFLNRARVYAAMVSNCSAVTIPWAMASSREMFSSWPASAFVVGVIIGSGKRWFSTIPSGSFTPHSSRMPDLYSRHALPAR